MKIQWHPKLDYLSLFNIDLNVVAFAPHIHYRYCFLQVIARFSVQYRVIGVKQDTCRAVVPLDLLP